MEGHESIFEKVTFEQRAEWQENRSLDNTGGEINISSRENSMCKCPGAEGEIFGTLEDVKEGGLRHKMRKRGIGDKKVDQGS